MDGSIEIISVVLNTLMHNVISVTVLLITINLGFYATYKDASGFEDLSSSGIWKFIFQKMAGIGFAVYCVESRIANFVGDIAEGGWRIVDTPRKRIGEFIRFAFDLILSYIALQMILSVYNFVLTGLFMDEAFADVAKGAIDHSSYRLFMSVQALINIFNHFSTVVSVGSFITAVLSVIIKCLCFVMFHAFFFSVLYGFLDHKVEVFDLSKRWSAWKEEEDDLKFETRMKHWWVDVVGETPVYATCSKRDNILPLFIAAFIMVILGLEDFASDSLSDLIATAIDAIDLINVVISFTVSWFTAKFMCRAGHKIVEQLPDEVQSKIEKLSQDLKGKADVIKAKRDKFAFKIDSIYRATNAAKERAGAWKQSRPSHERTVQKEEQTVTPPDFENISKPERPAPIINAGVPMPPISTHDAGERKEFYNGLRKFLEENGLSTDNVDDRDLGDLYVNMSKDRAVEVEAYRKAAREYNAACRKYNEYQQIHKTGAPLKELVPEDIDTITWDRGWYV